MKKTMYLVAAVCLMASCNDGKKEEQPKAELKADPSSVIDEARKAINEENLHYGDAFAKLDSSLFINHYTADACIMPPGAPSLCGKEGILGFYQASVKMGARNINITTDELMGSEDAMVEVGKYELFADSAKAKPVEKGKFMVVWKKVDGKWKMHRDIFNPSPAEAAPAK